MKQLESKIMELNAKLPALPEKAKAVIAKWLWAGALVSVVIYIIGIVTILSIGALTNLLLFSAGLGLASVRLWIMIITGVIGMGIALIAELFAIKPLKQRLIRGGISLSVWFVFSLYFRLYMILHPIHSAGYFLIF